HVRPALMFGQREPRRVPAVGVLPRRGVERQGEGVAQLRARAARRLILVEDAGPVAVECALRTGTGRGRQHSACGDTQDEHETTHGYLVVEGSARRGRAHQALAPYSTPRSEVTTRKANAISPDTTRTRAA